MGIRAPFIDGPVSARYFGPRKTRKEYNFMYSEKNKCGWASENIETI